MSCLELFRRSQLYRAVLDNRPDDLHTFSKEDELILGCSPLQLAQLLGHAACEQRLREVPPRCIKFSAFTEGETLSLSVEEFQKETGVRYLSHLRVVSLRVLAQGFRVCQRGGRRFFTEERRWLGSLFRLEIERGAVADVSVRWIDGELGYGVFAERAIKAHQFVGVYSGYLTRRPLLRFGLNEYRFYYETCGWSVRSLTVDAREAGNEMRFVNHSDAPNCEVLYLPYGGLTQIVFRSKRLIERGEQLSIDYGLDFWEAHSIPKRLL